MNSDKIMNLDPIIHAPTRLAILSVLISVKSATFTYIKESTGMTDGNLSVQLTKLEEHGLITIKKSFKGKKPQTDCTLTGKGRTAFMHYLDQLEQIVNMRKDTKE